MLFHYVGQEGRQVSLSGHVIYFALHEFILIFMAGHCIQAVARVNHLCIDAWLKLLIIMCLGLATQVTDFEIAFR